MKKVLLYMVLAVLGFSSCKKDKKPVDPTPPGGTKTYSVKFKIANPNGTLVTTSTGAIKVNDTDIPASVTRIIYDAYSSDNKLVSHIMQDNDAANFGNIEDNLPPGTYTINLGAGSNAMFGSGTLLSNNNVRYWDDTFATSFTLIVSNQPIDQSVTMHRIVGQVTVKLLDVLPNNAYSLKTEIDNDSPNYIFSTDKAANGPRTYFKTVIIPATAIGNTGYMQSQNVLNTGSAVMHKVTITCYDSTGKILAQTIVPNVAVIRNTNTILSGKVFGSDAAFTVTLNQQWGSTINQGF